MHFIFLLARTYPWWAVPMALVFAQLALFFWRRRSPLRFPTIAVALSLVVAAGLWIVYRGDLNSDRWVRTVFPNS